MRVAVLLTGEDGSGIIKSVREKSGLYLSFDETTKLAHFGDIYPSYEEALEHIKWFEAALAQVCKRDHVVFLREEGAKNFCTEREYTLSLLRHQRALQDLATPLASLSKLLKVC